MNILLVGLKENGNSSKLLLDLITPKYYIDKLYLSDAMEENKERLDLYMHRKIYDYCFIFVMDEKEEESIVIHTSAKDSKELLHANYEYDKLLTFLEEQEIRAKAIDSPIDSYSNDIYIEVLRKMKETTPSMKCILVAFPPVAKIDILKVSQSLVRFMDKSQNIL